MGACGRVAVYGNCTEDAAFRDFWLIMQLGASITYMFSTENAGSIPTIVIMSKP